MSHPSPPHPHSRSRRAPSPALRSASGAAGHRQLSPAPADLLRFVLDPRVAVGPKLLGVLALLYAVVPLDLVPDLLPVVGWLDDVGLLAVGFYLLARAWGRYRDEATRAGASEASAPPDERPDVSGAPSLVETEGTDVTRT